MRAPSVSISNSTLSRSVQSVPGRNSARYPRPSVMTTRHNVRHVTTLNSGHLKAEAIALTNKPHFRTRAARGLITERRKYHPRACDLAAVASTPGDAAGDRGQGAAAGRWKCTYVDGCSSDLQPPQQYFFPLQTISTEHSKEPPQCGLGRSNFVTGALRAREFTATPLCPEQ
ncbi:hypothetical protein EVAR_64185_1 [Eumeta japonica]|uniref:Uncharacterized protein n=1 Tax=Eumeta variegata TaxID=151549 RepID=A0A4C1ZFG6_EUMVA|nr:hypothetical protein EVAR_64185_1 [Eumeta japonica]